MIETSRLLTTPGPGLAEHLAQFGQFPSCTSELISEIDASGLTGRGGAGFPTGRKMAAVTGSKRVIVGNGAEGEPLSRKDFALLNRAPHLVLDGLDAAASALSADQTCLYVHPAAYRSVTAAIEERRAAGIQLHRIKVVEAPDDYVAGEETAAIRCIEGGAALPRDRTAPTATRGVHGKPTLVNNVETLANIALIARFGSTWFRAIGDPADPGTVLVSLSTTLDRPTVVEVPTGTPMIELIERGGSRLSDVSAVLLGGYHGTWLTATELATARLSGPALKPLGASPGARIIHVVRHDVCGLARVAEITRYLADQSARQCGPCRNGLPQLAGLLDELAHGQACAETMREVLRIAQLVDGRGACRHPDGSVRMIRSALRAFADDIDLHLRGRCGAAATAGRF